MNAQPADLQTLHFRTTVLRNLIYHRVLILEPIRRMAFRNMRHLSDAMADHPVPAHAEVGSVEFNKWVRELQDRMLRDQGSESSELDRVLIQIATFTPVKLYLGLLYAEIEYLGERPANTLCPSTKTSATSYGTTATLSSIQSVSDTECFIPASEAYLLKRHGSLAASTMICRGCR